MWYIAMTRRRINVINTAVDNIYRNGGGEIHVIYPSHDILCVITTNTTVDSIQWC